MLDSVFTVSVQVWILFALIGVGALARKLKIVDRAGVSAMTDLLVLVVTPCLMVDAFQRPFDPSLLRQLGLAFAFATALHLALIALACGLFRTKDDAMPVLRLATVFSNAGFMAIPLELALIGSRGVFFGIVYVAVFNLFFWSWGAWGMRHEKAKGSFFSRASFLNPSTVGLAIALGLFLSHVRLPAPVREPVRLLALLNTPLAMLVIGYHLSGAKLGVILRRPSAFVAAALRLVAAPLLLLAFFLPFRASLDRAMMLALVIAAAAPVGALVAVLSAREGRDVDLGVALVCGTTLLSILTMPLLVALAMHAVA